MSPAIASDSSPIGGGAVGRRGKEQFDLRNWHFDGMQEIHALRNCHDYRREI
jgi:hypothetical protein